MKVAIAAALALDSALAPRTEGTPVATDLRYTMPVAGSWTYLTTAGGGNATFTDAMTRPQLVISCSRATRRVKVSKSASAPSPSLWIWTSSQTRSIPASYDSSAARVTAELSAYDPLLDALASSRGRIGFSVSGLDALVVPPWAEVGRVVEDCRA
jgi:hypothetical protein